MSESTLPPDILRVIYENLDDSHKPLALCSLLLVSRTFYLVFCSYAYRRVVLPIANPSRLALLVKIFRTYDFLPTGMHSLTILLAQVPKPPTVRFHRIPNLRTTVTDHLARFVRIIIEARPPDLKTIAFVSPRDETINFQWTTLNQVTRDLLVDLRCQTSSIRKLKFECINELSPFMVWGNEGRSTVERIDTFRVGLSTTTLQPRAEIPIAQQIVSLETLAMRLTGPLLQERILLRNLQSLEFSQPPRPTEVLVRQPYAIVADHKATLRYLHLRLIHQHAMDNMPDFANQPRGNAAAPLQLDLSLHQRLHSVVLSKDLPPHPPQYNQSMPYAISIMGSELTSFVEFLRWIDLPPLLPNLRIYVHLLGQGEDWSSVLRELNDPDALDTIAWRFQHLDEELVDTIMRASVAESGGALQHSVQLCVIPSTSLGIREDQLVEIEKVFTGMKRIMGDGFKVSLESDII